MDIVKGFEDAKPNSEVNKKQQEEEQNKQEATVLLYRMSNVLSTGAIQVQILKPKRKEPWARHGSVTAIVPNFHLQKIKVKVSYPMGLKKKINGKDEFVPYEDTFFINEIAPIKVLNQEPPKKKEEDE